MIIDALQHALENPLYPAIIRQTLQQIQLRQPDELPPGKYLIDGDEIFFSVMEAETRDINLQLPEFHRKYIDIHLVLTGEEIIGTGTSALTRSLIEPFDESKDLGFCHSIDSETLVHLQRGELAIIFPLELHRPMCTLSVAQPLRKIVVKINQALLK
ncbi:YhcH/YjgK/YiaL family protein [Candidatus Pantoea multigeneris]|uniref:DUF386 domain-containing protein n=1 Tax=Candidatus Pantoea multigeneris TaxID=2608357 RepID=A0ABX0REU5_9GAMM|nr:YhcH/YjgK/YiaL family protein [Pantoea multigeneris]NIF23873.1 DUF386 domain-containing protein [Pantoea multigeneris]